MTVEELREILKKYPPDMEIYVPFSMTPEESMTVNYVRSKKELTNEGWDYSEMNDNGLMIGA